MARAPRARLANSYARRGAVREPYDYVLIVCEGSKTEPNYLHGLRAAYRLSNANIRVLDPGGNDPMTLVQFAEAELNREPYDRAYCVFDRDGHVNYEAALRRAAASELGRSNRLHVVPSVPSFEIWLLLHFGYTTAPFASADAVIRDLKKAFPGYTKGHQRCFELLSDRLEDAIAHATRLERYNSEARSSNPATHMHRLVTYLRGLKAPGR